MASLCFTKRCFLFFYRNSFFRSFCLSIFCTFIDIVNIANADPTQIPGKAFEYLGSQRPILHLGGDGDAVGSLLKERKRGWTIANDKASIESWLLWALAAKHSGRLDSGLNLDIDSVAEYDWDALAERVEHIAMEFLIPR